MPRPIVNLRNLSLIPSPDNQYTIDVSAIRRTTGTGIHDISAAYYIVILSDCISILYISRFPVQVTNMLLMFLFYQFQIESLIQLHFNQDMEIKEIN